MYSKYITEFPVTFKFLTFLDVLQSSDGSDDFECSHDSIFVMPKISVIKK